MGFYGPAMPSGAAWSSAGCPCCFRSWEPSDGDGVVTSADRSGCRNTMLPRAGQGEAVLTWAGACGGGQPRLRQAVRADTERKGPLGAGQGARGLETPFVSGSHSLVACARSCCLLEYAVRTLLCCVLEVFLLGKKRKCVNFLWMQPVSRG